MHTYAPTICTQLSMLIQQVAMAMACIPVKHALNETLMRLHVSKLKKLRQW